ncbi:hypothetical protein [Persicobacter sp. CCB-QB2]|uniref:hypothetical protein n=1 Tax=Persicobacter sp. CCB-QB2 TaxID=1561025 RepID=UPI0006A99568|nr:hypothetical protein [Persicobacter sp. CCB-QB2]
MEKIIPQKITVEEDFSFEFSICSFVTDLNEYEEMVASFQAKGFSASNSEFLFVDNSQGNSFEAFGGINRMLRQARGRYVIICHQDILLQEDGKAELEAKIAEIESIDPNWGILGNAGGVNLKYNAFHISHPQEDLREQHLPLKAINLDENFLIIKAAANLNTSADLKGFHLYGTDICLLANIRGYQAYVIDFKIFHKSKGNANKSFFEIKNALKNKYEKAFAGRFVGTTITRFYVSGSKWKNLVINSGFVMFWARQYYKFFKPKKHYKPH